MVYYDQMQNNRILPSETKFTAKDLVKVYGLCPKAAKIIVKTYGVKAVGTQYYIGQNQLYWLMHIGMLEKLNQTYFGSVRRVAHEM